MKNRGNKILELLTKDNKIEVSHLAEELGVSQVTMRKDLDTLESKGVIKREHGFALLCSTDDINGRIAYHYEEKRKIAQKAAGLVSNGDTIMIENGSCCALLADTLLQTAHLLQNIFVENPIFRLIFWVVFISRILR